MQIWRMPADGEPAVQITTAGASHNPSESADGKKVYYHVLRDPGEIWSIPVEGGEAVKVTGPTQRFPVGFAVTAEGVYYDAAPACGRSAIRSVLQFLHRTGQTGSDREPAIP